MYSTDSTSTESRLFCLFHLQMKLKKKYIVEACMRANTQKRTTRGAGDKRGGRGKEKKTVGNRDMKSVEGERDGAGYTRETRWTRQGI